MAKDTASPTGKDAGPSKSVDPFALVSQIKSKGPAPVHLWDPPFCGDMDMRIARDGTWYHEGSAIRRMPMVQLFSSILKLGEDNEYYLVTPSEKVRIQVDDCPFVAVAMEVSGEGRDQQLRFETNTGEFVTANADNPLRIVEDPETAEPHPTVHVRSGLMALINRAVFYRLVELAVEQPDSARGDASAEQTLNTGVWSGGEFFRLTGASA